MFSERAQQWFPGPTLRIVAVWLDAEPPNWQKTAMEALHEAGASGGFTVCSKPNWSAVDLIVQLTSGLAARAECDRLFIEDEDGLGCDRLGEVAINAGRRSVVVRVVQEKTDGSRRVMEEGALPLTPVRPRRSREALLDIVADWPARVLRGWRSSGKVRAYRAGGVAPRRAARWTGWMSLARCFVDEMARATREEQWALGYANATAGELLGGLRQETVRWAEPLDGGYLADPMVVPDGTSTPTVLAEAYWFRERKGKIVALRNGKSDASIVIDRPWHLSYPFLWREGGEIWCIPEMAQAGRIQLFRAEAFPDRWAEGPVLVDVFAGIDPTLHHDGERYWLFAGNARDLPNARLYLFYSQQLDGPWQRHPWNPIRCDLRNSRSAGPLFMHEGQLFRPAQDCSSVYGGAVVLNRVHELSPNAFHEEAAVRLEPDAQGPYPDGLHTFCAAGPVTIIDGKRYVRTFSTLPAKVREFWSVVKNFSGAGSGDGGRLRCGRSDRDQ